MIFDNARKILSVFAGYGCFVAGSLAIFALLGGNPHAEASSIFQVQATVYGVYVSFFSGLMVPLISKDKDLNLNYILAVVIAGFATFSLFKAEGSHWTQLLAIFVFTPTSIAGGFYWLHRKQKEPKS